MATDGLWNLYAVARVIFVILVVADIIAGIAVGTCDNEEKAKERKELFNGLLKATGIAFLVMLGLLLLYQQSFVGLNEYMENE